VNHITDLILILNIIISLIANPDFCSLKHITDYKSLSFTTDYKSLSFTTDYKSLCKHVNDITDLILILYIIISLIANPDFCSLKKA